MSEPQGYADARVFNRVLVVDDELSMREMLGIMLGREGFEVQLAASRAEAARVLAGGPVGLVITDVRLPDGDGMEILRHVKAASPETVVIVMTAYGSTQAAVGALKMGAQDYLIKPFDIDELRIVVRNCLDRRRLEQENVLLRAELGTQHGLDRMVGTSPAMAGLFTLVRAVAPTHSTVLVTGESGTGKELVARAVHALSPRRDAPFVSVNCGALPETLLESELFGHVRGAFTDAHQNKKGLFEVAHRGTLFLDEVGETSPSMQVKLLRVLQEKCIRRVGGTDETEVDVRVVAATNKPLEPMVRENRFRADLFYRLNVIPILVPPLRERQGDIVLLAEHFLRRFRRVMDKGVNGFASAAMTALEAHHWPGNVRELENVVERAVALETTGIIQAERLADLAPAMRTEAAGVTVGEGFDLDAYLTQVEHDLLVQALQKAGPDRSHAARLLGVSPRSLRYLLHKHHLARAMGVR